MNTERMKLVEQIFGEVLACDGPERERLLASRCGEDSQLRREVGLLLGFADVEDGVLDGSAPELVELPRTDQDLSLLPAGTKIGPYTINSMLGVGGMGVVYVGEQARPKRTVALKVIRPGFATPSVLKRFEYESELLGRLQHPGIARIIEAGAAQTPFGIQPFFAMELVEGEPLGAYAQRHRLDARAKVRLVVKICDAVEHAHQRGVIHRDLKPANILVDAAGQPKILDFGVARATGGREAEQRLTLMRTGERQLVGTLAYMSPEQISGDARGVDTRSDVYSLGVVLFELLAGQLPHSLSDKALPDAVRVIRDEDPRRLSSISRVLRGDLDTITGKALAKDPTHRYQSAAMLAADLTRFLENQPILARPPSVAYQIKKFAARHRTLATAGVAAVLCLAAGLAASLVLWREAEAARELAVREGDRAVLSMKAAQEAQRDAEAEAARQQVIVKFFHDNILTKSYSTGPSTATVASLESAIAQMPGVFAKDPLNEARLLYSASQILVASGNITRANACLNRALSLYEASPKPPLQELFDTRVFYTNQILRYGQPQHAFTLIERNLTIVDQLPDAVLKRRSLEMLRGVAFWSLGRYDQAEPLLSTQIDSLLADEKLTTMVAFVTTNRLAPMYAEMGLLDRCQSAWDRLVEREEKLAGPDLSIGQFLDYAAITYEQIQNWPRAATQRRRAAENFDRFLPAGSINQVAARSLLLRNLIRVGTPAALAEARLISADQLVALTRGGDPFPEFRVDLYADRLAALIASRDLTAAAKLLPKALAAADEASVKPYQMLQVRLEAARLLLAQSHPSDAVPLALGEHERRVRIRGRTSPETLEALALVRESLVAAGRGDEARAYVQRQIDTRISEVGLRDFDTITLLKSAAEAAATPAGGGEGRAGELAENLTENLAEDLADAERYFSIAWRESEALTGWNAKRSLELRVALANVRARAGRPDAARALLEDGLIKCQQEYGNAVPVHPRSKILTDAIAALSSR